MARKNIKKANSVFFNRELSWIEFNARVLAEAQKKTVPLLERLRFLAIVSSNFDEFFMVRVASLKNQAVNDLDWTDVSGLTAKEQLERIAKRAHEIFDIQHKLLNTDILPALKKEGIVYVPPSLFTPEERQFAEHLFQKQIFPLLTPLRTGINGELPHIANLRLYVAFLLKPIIDNPFMPAAFKTAYDETPLALVQLPSSIKREVWLPSGNDSKERHFTLLEDIIVSFGTQLFAGYSVEESLVFKAVCDAAFAVDEEREDDFIEAMEEILLARQESVPIRLTCTASSPAIAKLLIEKTGLETQDVYNSASIIDLAGLNGIANAEGFSHLRYPSWKNFYPADMEQGEPLWDTLKKRDVLLHVPYESYEPVINFISTAAEDENVLAIKMTLYRTSGDSPIISALEQAARRGKQVTVFVELKARFDEKQNISWAQKLQQAGIIVVHGIANLKVHAKILMVVRRENEDIVRYVHMATGNYNDKTARFYVDMSLFTTNPGVANDATIFFNMISGYSTIQSMKKLFMAPINLKTRLLAMIDREIQHSTAETPGLIMAKMNSLAHPEIIQALYRASRSNVCILLNVRGICMLVPDVKRQSENISVISIVDRFLEHTRIFYFQNGGAEEIYLSSADWMPRNLDRRIELMFPVRQDDLFDQIKDTLAVYFSDNMQSHYLTSSGAWVMRKPQEGEEPVRAQTRLYNSYRLKDETGFQQIKREFIVRRKDD